MLWLSEPKASAAICCCNTSCSPNGTSRSTCRQTAKVVIQSQDSRCLVLASPTLRRAGSHLSSTFLWSRRVVDSALGSASMRACVCRSSEWASVEPTHCATANPSPLSKSTRTNSFATARCSQQQNAHTVQIATKESKRQPQQIDKNGGD